MLPSATDLRIPRAEHARAEAIWTLTDGFCASSLDDEYALLCRRLVGRLARKRPSPLQDGRSASWAAGVICAVGRLNFVFDRSQRPHVSADQIAGALGTAKSTMSAKASHIGSLLALGPLEPDLCRAELLEHHPLAWLVSVDGIIVDARMLPPQLQRQAHDKGSSRSSPPRRGERPRHPATVSPTPAGPPQP